MQTDFKITVRDILQSPHFKNAKIVAGTAGLNRIVNWVHILEGKKYITQYVNGQELILSSGVGFESKEEAISFLKQLIKRNVSALCIELVENITELPEEIIKIADDHRFPIIVFTDIVRFVDITRDLHTRIILLRDLYIKEKRTHEENQWIDAWLNNKLTENEILQHLKIIEHPFQPTGYVVCLVNFDVQNNHHKSLHEFMIHTTYLARSFFEQQGFFLFNSFENNQMKYVLLDKRAHKTWKKRIDTVIKQLKEVILIKNLISYNINITFGIGKMIDQINELYKSFQNAQEAISIQKRLKIEQPLYELHHIYRIISLVDKHCNLHEFALDYLGPIIEYDIKNNTELLNTLKVYYECNGSKQETAKRLFIARQTLYLRIQKLEELLGVDFMSSEKRMAIEFALYAYHYTT